MAQRIPFFELFEGFAPPIGLRVLLTDARVTDVTVEQESRTMALALTVLQEITDSERTLLEQLLADRFALNGVRISLTQGGFPKQEPRPSSAGGGVRKESNAGKIIMGREIKGHPMPMSELNPKAGNVVVEGKVFKCEFRELRQPGMWLALIEMTDYEGSVIVRKRMLEKDVAPLRDRVSTGMWLRVAGTMELTYDGHGVLTEAILDGKALELFDIVDRDGTPTGLVKERGVAHLDGSPHPTVHTWITRTTSDGRLQVLLQQRSHEKDAWPDCYDISSAGHIPHGSTPLASAVREAKEELGLTIQKEDLHLLGHRLRERERVFHDRLFHDCEYSTIYLYQLKNPNPGFVLQESEVARIRWMTLRELNLSVKNPAFPHCLDDEAELEMLRTALQNLKS